MFDEAPSFPRSVEIFDITVDEVFVRQVFAREAGDFSVRLEVGAGVLPVRQSKRRVVEERRPEADDRGERNAGKLVERDEVPGDLVLGRGTDVGHAV